MSKDIKIRWGWLRGMYIYTIVLSGGFGLGIIFVPEMIKTMFTWPVQEPIAFGIIGSIYVAFGLLAILGLRSPLKFVSVLLMQLCYKLVFLIGVIIPMLIAGKLPDYAMFTIMIFATYIIGDLIAIPFSYVFEKRSDH